MTLFEAIYEIRCKSPIGWFEVGEARLIGPDMVGKIKGNSRKVENSADSPEILYNYQEKRLGV